MTNKALYLCLFVVTGITTVRAQTGNVGIGTTTPGSKLTVNGSFGAAYTSVTANYTMTVDDYFVVSNSAANSTITLPQALPPGSGNYRGRLYMIKNTSTSSVLTIAANGGELINVIGIAGAATITVSAGEAVTLVSTGATSGITWEVVAYQQTTPPTTSYVTIERLSASAAVTGGGTANLNFGTHVFATDGIDRYGGPALGWTAPQSGVYAFDFNLRVEENETVAAGDMTTFHIQIIENPGSVRGIQSGILHANGIGSGAAMSIAGKLYVNVVAGNSYRLMAVNCLSCGINNILVSSGTVSISRISN